MRAGNGCDVGSPSGGAISATDEVSRLRCSIRKRIVRAATALTSATASILFKFDGLVLAGFIQRRAPDLVRSLVFGAANTELGSKAKVGVRHILQDVAELLGM